MPPMFPIPEFAETAVVGGMYHGRSQPVPICRANDNDFKMIMPSIGGSCPCDPEDMVIDEVRFDQRYYLRLYCIEWPNGTIWEYRFWCHETLLDTIEENSGIIPLFDCFVKRYYIAQNLGPDSPLISLGHGLTASKN